MCISCMLFTPLPSLVVFTWFLRQVTPPSGSAPQTLYNISHRWTRQLARKRSVCLAFLLLLLQRVWVGDVVEEEKVINRYTESPSSYCLTTKHSADNHLIYLCLCLCWCVRLPHRLTASPLSVFYIHLSVHPPSLSSCSSRCSCACLPMHLLTKTYTKIILSLVVLR